MTTPTSIEKLLCQSLRETVHELHTERATGNRKWAKAIKEKLGFLGHENGCMVCTSGFNGIFERGWPYDLVWYQEDNKGYLLDVPLVVESDWLEKFSEVKFDFEKLLAARATHRLMICNCRTRHKDQRFLQYFRDAVQSLPAPPTRRPLSHCPSRRSR